MKPDVLDRFLLSPVRKSSLILEVLVPMTSLTDERIDIEISCQKRHLCFLSTERNRRVVAVKCPPEILTEVFCCVVRRIIANIGINSPKDQLAVSHVCHHWRAVVLRSQKYWSYQPIGIRGFLWSTEMVRRAGRQPLRLWMVIGRYPRESYNQHRSRALRRAVSLHIPIPYQSHSESVSYLIKAFPQTFPTLESVVLTTNGEQSLDISDFTIFPRLRRLVVDGFSWSWNPLSLISTLTHLTLRGRIDQIWGEQCWLSVVRLTNLMSLDIADTNTPQYKDDTSDFDFSGHSPIINLQHLQYMCIAADPLSITLLIRQFELTPLTSVSINCTYLRRSWEDADDDTDFLQLSCLLKWIRRYVRGLDKAGSELRSLEVQGDPFDWEDNAVILRLWTSECLPPQRQDTSEGNMRPHLKIRLANAAQESEGDDPIGDGFGKELRSYLWRIIPWLRLTKLRNLRIDDSGPAANPEEIFSALPKVEVLSLSNVELIMPLHALSSRGARSGRCLLPALHTLVIYDTHDVEDRDVLDLVKYRIKCGRPLQNVHIIQCLDIRPSFIEKLRKKVPSVVYEEYNEKERNDRWRDSAIFKINRNRKSRSEEEEEEEEW
ncbi:hypothetical protein NLI96_g4660 [Meripilus lineatus]|uniref:F-box domain-containing protein n=1 Tax=Meripilus lineatus TaxID=2056292 RepID=A0AAD5V4G3_9APHY|nr:hypothetical protein NLI96_g4660 [Physisporinus lineatus]